jgi:AcrR family transcriptional regulator
VNSRLSVVPSNSKEAILDAAEEIMANVGYERASIAQICRESGLPVGSVYHHFGSKAGLLAAVMERGITRFYETMNRRTVNPSLSNEQRLRDYWLGAADTIHANLNYFLLEADLVRFGAHDPEVTSVVARARELTQQRLDEVLLPYARELGIPDPASVTRRMVRLTLVFTRGAVIEAGGDLDTLRALLADLHESLRATMRAVAATHADGITANECAIGSAT